MAYIGELGLTLDEVHFRSMDKSTRRIYGKGISELVETSEPAFVFQVLRIGLLAIFAQGENRHLVRGAIYDDEVEITGVIDRDLDGAAAYDGAVAASVDIVMDRLTDAYESGEEDFVISVERRRSFMDKIYGREAIVEEVAVIPHHSKSKTE